MGLIDEDRRPFAVAERMHGDRYGLTGALRELQEPGRGLGSALVEAACKQLVAVVLADPFGSESGDELAGGSLRSGTAARAARE